MHKYISTVGSIHIVSMSSLPGHFVRAGHGNKSLVHQCFVPSLIGPPYTYRKCPLAHLHLHPEMAVEVPDQSVAAGFYRAGGNHDRRMRRRSSEHMLLEKPQWNMKRPHGITPYSTVCTGGLRDVFLTGSRELVGAVEASVSTGG